MHVILARHGNTFGPDQRGGERIFMAGRAQNIPLVEKGREQARALARYLAEIEWIPDAIYANHLLRTWEYAAIIREYFFLHQHQSIALIQDESLVELDYGAWGGVSTGGSEGNQVIAQFGQKPWDDWQQQRVIANYPPHNWQETEAQISARIAAFFALLRNNHDHNARILAVGSQGSISFVHTLLPDGMSGAIDNHQLRVKTGNFCELVFSETGYKIKQWDKQPKILSLT